VFISPLNRISKFKDQKKKPVKKHEQRHQQHKSKTKNLPFNPPIERDFVEEVEGGSDDAVEFVSTSRTVAQQ